MSALIARANIDIGVGVCPCHTSPVSYTTMFITGASTVTLDGQPMAIVGSIGISSCGHATTALTGSPISTANGQPIHRVGDTGSNCGAYTVLTGSSNSGSN
jgi:uncharacterized Zn-binding protein involved in type VI secretion